MTRSSLRIFFLTTLLGLMAAPVLARDREFGLVVQRIESHYHARRSHRYLIGFASGFANVVVKFWHPYGVKNFKLALFEDQDLRGSQGGLDFPAVLQAGLREGWQPLVQVYSRRTGEFTYIFARNQGKNFKVLVAALNLNDAVVVQVKVNADKLIRSIDRCREHPDEIAQSVRQGPGESED